jgi:predicted nucleic acid-binding protein
LTISVNLDTSTPIAFVSEGSPVRQQLKAYVQGKGMVMTDTAAREFGAIIAAVAGPQEQARAARFLSRITTVPDNPSRRALTLVPTRNLEPNDIIILGTGDQLGIVTMTADQRAVRAAQAQGVDFQVFIHSPVPLAGA